MNRLQSVNGCTRVMIVLTFGMSFLRASTGTAFATTLPCPRETRTLSQDVVNVPYGQSGPPLVLDLAPCEQVNFSVTLYRSDAWAGTIGGLALQSPAGETYEAPSTLWAEGRGSGGPDQKIVVFSKPGRTFDGARPYRAVVQQNPKYGGNLKYALTATVVPRPGYNDAGETSATARVLTRPAIVRGQIVARPDPGHFYRLFVPARGSVPFTVVLAHRGWPYTTAQTIVRADDESIVAAASVQDLLIQDQQVSFSKVLTNPASTGRWYTLHLYNDREFAVWNTRTELKYAVCTDDQVCTLDAPPTGRYEVHWQRGQHCRAPKEPQSATCSPTLPQADGACRIDIEVVPSSTDRATMTAHRCFGFVSLSATLARNQPGGGWTIEKGSPVLIDGKKTKVAAMNVTTQDGETTISGSLVLNGKSVLCEATGPSCTVTTFSGSRAVSCGDDPSDIGSADSATEVTVSSARLRAYARTCSGAGTFYFEYWQVPVPQSPHERFRKKTTARRQPVQQEATFLFTELVTKLQPNATYQYRLCGRAKGVRKFTCSSVKVFLTTTPLVNPPVASTPVGSLAPLSLGDPKLIADGARYYVMGSGCALFSSTDFKTWANVGPVCSDVDRPQAMVLVPSPPDQNVNFWGTEIGKVGSTYVLTTSGMRAWSGYSRGAIWIGTASNIGGPYVWAADATAKDANATLIDPSIFVDPRTGIAWLTWTRHVDRPKDGLHNEIVAQALDPGDPTRLAVGSSPVVLLSTDVQPQDREMAFNPPGRRIVEGQGLLFHDGKYFLYYAAGTVEYAYGARGGRAYTFNVASSASFPVRFAKPERESLAGGRGWRLPGHGSVFRDGTNDFWLATHAYQDADPYCEGTWPCDVSPECRTKECCCGLFGRKLYLQKMLYDPITRAFVVGDGMLQPGPMAPPVP